MNYWVDKVFVKSQLSDHELLLTIKKLIELKNDLINDEDIKFIERMSEILHGICQHLEKQASILQFRTSLLLTSGEVPLNSYPTDELLNRNSDLEGFLKAIITILLSYCWEIFYFRAESNQVLKQETPRKDGEQANEGDDNRLVDYRKKIQESLHFNLEVENMNPEIFDNLLSKHF